MNARDELAEVIKPAASYDFWPQKAAELALAAGYRTPRTITTAEERSTLKPGTICRDEFGNAWKRGVGSWVGTGEGGPLWDDLDLEMTVLYEPEPQP